MIVEPDPDSPARVLAVMQDLRHRLQKSQQDLRLFDLAHQGRELSVPEKTKRNLFTAVVIALEDQILRLETLNPDVSVDTSTSNE